MPTYLHPGVYIEEVPSGARPIEAAATSTAVIIGYATKGPEATPELIFNWGQYAKDFGGINNFDGQTPPVDYMGHTVQAFFDNGGGKAYIVRLADGAAKSSAKLITVPASATVPGDIQNYLDIEAINAGTWADGLTLELSQQDATATPLTFELSIGRLNDDGDLIADEVFGDLTLDSADDGFLPTIVNQLSQLIQVKPVTFSTLTATDKEPFYLGTLTSGDLSTLTPTEIAALNGGKLIMTLDETVVGNAASNVDFDAVTLATTTATTPEEIAQQIQAGVNGGATAAKTGFTCTVENGRLVLISGTRKANSSVKVTAGTPDAAAGLKLLAATSTAMTGDEAFFATFSPTSPATLSGGGNGSIPVSKSDYDPIFTALRKFRDINIIMIPDHQWGGTASKSILGAARKHAEFMKTGMVLIDPPAGSELKSANDVSGLGLPTSTYAALYYPWPETANPHYHPEKRPHLKPTYRVPPSGFAAGMWAKTDSRRGVWKAPAGLATGLIGVLRTEYKVGNDEQDALNPEGVNCYRTILSEPVIWGSRTLATRADPEWRYVPIRRTAMMIEESIYQGIQWAVFEPNDHNLWASLRLNIGNFMDGLHRAGAFQGEKASDAYYVRCGLDATMTQGDIDAGRVIVEVGFAPLKPAEFVIVRIQQIVAQQ